MANSDAANETTWALSFAAGVYELEAIKRAAYRFSDRVVVEIEPLGEAIRCVLTPLTTVQAKDLESVASAFCVEVLDQDLRLKIAQETEPFRNLILSLAFSKTGLQE